MLIPRLLTPAEAAEFLHKSPQTLLKWAHPSVAKIGCCKVGGKVLIPESEVVRIIKDGMRPASPIWRGQR